MQSEMELLLPSTNLDVVLLDYQNRKEEGARLLDVLSGVAGIGLVLMGDIADDYRMLLDRPLRGRAMLTKEAERQEMPLRCVPPPD